MSYTLSADQFVDYLLDRGGLVDFVRVQLAGQPESQWSVADWQRVTETIWLLSERLWTPSVAYVIDLYGMQKERASFWVTHNDAKVASAKMWRERAVRAEQALSDIKKVAVA